MSGPDELRDRALKEIEARAADPDFARIDNWFSYHRPEGDQAERYERLRAAGGQLARIIAELCPPSADRTVAIRKVREAVYSANASIACGGK